MKRHIPNFLTCLNLFSGCIAATFAFKGELSTAVMFVMISAVLDFFDGLAARALNAHSPIGKDLDSLADVISFGFVPGALLFMMMAQITEASGLPELLNYTAFLIPVFSALRLAKFNNDPAQSVNFKGVPVPASALFFSGIALSYENRLTGHTLYSDPYLLAGVIIVFSFLLVSNIPVFSLKLKSLSWKANDYVYILLAASAGLLVYLGLAAIPFIILTYILISLLYSKKI